MCRLLRGTLSGVHGGYKILARAVVSKSHRSIDSVNMFSLCLTFAVVDRIWMPYQTFFSSPPPTTGNKLHGISPLLPSSVVPAAGGIW